MAVFTDEQIEEIMRIMMQNFGVHQYIGARYVPIFGRKDEDTWEWDNNAPYEPLTVVQYQGNSYTSRQYVPAGLGTPDQHNDFWAETGNWNAQIEAYRQAVLQFDGRITENANDIEEIRGKFPITTGDIANNAVSLPKLSTAVQNLFTTTDNEINAIKANSWVTTQRIADDAITHAKIADGAVTSINIADDAITHAKIADGAVTSINIADDAITHAKIADGAITSINIADDAITHAKIADGAITSININDGAIGLVDLNSNVQQRIHNNNNRYSFFVFVGDSYGRGVGGNDMKGWPYYAANFLNIPESSYINVSNSGAGFIAKGHSSGLDGLTFSEQLDYAYNHLPENVTANDVTHVVVAGGYNDHGRDGIGTAVTNTLNHAESLFPNARVFFIPLCVGDRELNAEFYSSYHNMVIGAMRAGAATTENGIYWLYPYQIQTSHGDNIHPNDSGYSIEGYNIASFIMGGTCEVFANILGAGAEGYALAEGVTNNGFRCGVTNGVCWASGAFTRTGHGDLFTLPSYLRPIKTVYLLAFFYGSSTNHGIARIRITSNGVVSWYASEYGTGGDIACTVYLPYITEVLGHTYQ